MKSQIILKCVDIDQRTYDANYLLVNGTVNQNYTNVYYGYCNYSRSQIIFNNISLKNAISNYHDKDKFHMKLIKIEGQREYDANCLREATDPQSILTSNLYLKGLPFLGNTSERLLNVIRIPSFPNRFISFFNTRTLVGGFSAYSFNNSGFVGGASSSEMLDFISAYIPQNTIQYFRMNTIPDAYNGVNALSATIENVILQFGNWGYVSNTSIQLQQVKIVSSQADASFTGVNNTSLNCYIEFLPTTNLNYIFVPNENTANNEVTFYKPRNDNVNITLELRDLLNNTIQPVATTTGIYPSFTYHFEID